LTERSRSDEERRRRPTPDDPWPPGCGTLDRVNGSNGHRVLVVDDEVPLAELIDDYLTAAGFAVTTCHTGPEAVTTTRRLQPDVLVLDLGLPGLDGIEVCRQVRTFSDCYVVMVTARDDEVDTLIGLSVGADDYLTKPFSPRELVARVQAMIRRPRTVNAAGTVSSTGPEQVARTEEPSSLRFGDLAVDVAGREVRLGSAPIELTRTEFDLLATLARRPRLAFSRRQLLEEVWGPGWVGDDHVVDVHVGHIRRKLGDDAGRARYVRTVRGVGYRMGEG
jgi:DNA-binding response OmpR family regulator